MTDCCNKEEQHRSKTLSSHRATVTDDVSKFGYISVIFLDLGAKLDEIYYCDLLLSQQLLLAIRRVSSEFILVCERSAIATFIVSQRVCLWVCRSVVLSVPIFKMLLLRQFLSE